MTELFFNHYIESPDGFFEHYIESPDGFPGTSALERDRNKIIARVSSSEIGCMIIRVVGKRNWDALVVPKNVIVLKFERISAIACRKETLPEACLLAYLYGFIDLFNKNHVDAEMGESEENEMNDLSDATDEMNMRIDVIRQTICGRKKADIMAYALYSRMEYLFGEQIMIKGGIRRKLLDDPFAIEMRERFSNLFDNTYKNAIRTMNAVLKNIKQSPLFVDPNTMMGQVCKVVVSDIYDKSTGIQIIVDEKVIVDTDTQNGGGRENMKKNHLLAKMKDAIASKSAPSAWSNKKANGKRKSISTKR